MDSPLSIQLENLTHEELIEKLKTDREKLTTANKELKMEIKDMKKKIIREQNGSAMQIRQME